MSAAYWLLIDTGGPSKVSVWNTSVTYNLGPMLRAAGFPEWQELLGRTASDAAPMLLQVAGTLRDNQARYEMYNPPSGWGDYDGAVRWVTEFAQACADHPKTEIGGAL